MKLRCLSSPLDELHMSFILSIPRGLPFLLLKTFEEGPLSLMNMEDPERMLKKYAGFNDLCERRVFLFDI